MLENFGDGIANAINNLLGPIARLLESYVWGWPEDVPLLAVLLLGTGLFITVRLGLVQIREGSSTRLASFAASTTVLKTTVILPTFKHSPLHFQQPLASATSRVWRSQSGWAALVPCSGCG